MKYYLIIGLIFASLSISAQSLSRFVFSSGGTSASNNSGTIAFTIGEPLNTTFFNPNKTYSLTQGFHQSQILIVNITPEKSIATNFSVYPNPTRDIFYCNLNNYKNEDFIFQIFDIEGKMINIKEHSNMFSQSTIEFNLSEFKKGTYIFRIISKDNSELIGTYKIVKVY